MRSRFTKPFNLIIAVCVALLCVIILNESTMADKNTTIKVGFYKMNGFQEYDKEGNYSGYNVDYLNIIARRGRWNIEYVQVRDFTEGMRALENKEIDLLAPCELSNERMDDFLYSKFSFGTDYYVLVADADNEEATYENFDYINKMKVAVIKDYPLTDEFIEYMSKNNLSAELIYYDTVDETLEAVKNKEVDGAVTSLMVADDDFKVMVKYYSSPFYYMTWKGNEDMMYKVNEMMRYIETIYPQVIKDLQDKYYPIYSEQQFSAKELEFINHQNIIRVAYMDNYLPISFKGADGELDGASRKIFDEIQRITGLKFQYVELPQGKISYDYFVNNKIDLVTGVTYNSENVNSDKLVLSIPYLWSSKVFVAKDATSFSKDDYKKVVLVKGSETLGKVMRKEYPNFSIEWCETMEECLKKVKNGDADYLFTNQFVASNLVLMPKYAGLAVVPVEGLSDELCFAAVVKEGQNDYTDEERMMLIKVIDKAISSIGQDKLNEYAATESIAHRYKYTIWDYIYVYRFLIISISIAVLFFGLVCFYFIKHKIEVRKRNIKEAKNRIILQRRYEAILHNSDVIIYEIDIKNNRIMLADKFREKFGRSVPDQVAVLTGEITADLFGIHPDDRPIMLDTYYFNKEASVGDNEVLIRIANKNGEYIWCNVTRVPIFNSEDEIVSIVGKIVDVDEQVKEKQLLEEKARTDGLSGLLNKATFIDEVNKYLGEHSSYYSAMIFVDMDHFKDINDKFGHEIGDKAIRDISEKLGLIFSNIDFVSRYGGDEFCVFVKNIPEHTLKDKIEWALEKLKATYESENGEVHVTASIGVAFCKCNNATYETMLRVSDEAVYEVKENGRNGYSIKEII